jgi:hypothetical protein
MATSSTMTTLYFFEYSRPPSPFSGEGIVDSVHYFTLLQKKRGHKRPAHYRYHGIMSSHSLDFFGRGVCR